jgi:hypothetical protein
MCLLPLQAVCGGGREPDARALLELLAPDGVLFHAMLAADQQDFNNSQSYSEWRCVLAG